MKIVGFRTPKPRGFSYKPRYYDPDKEAREERRRELYAMRGETPPEDKEANKSGEATKGGYRPGQYIEAKRESRIMANSSDARKSSRSKIMTLIVVVMILAYLIFF